MRYVMHQLMRRTEHDDISSPNHVMTVFDQTAHDHPDWEAEDVAAAAMQRLWLAHTAEKRSDRRTTCWVCGMGAVTMSVIGGIYWWLA